MTTSKRLAAFRDAPLIAATADEDPLDPLEDGEEEDPKNEDMDAKKKDKTMTKEAQDGAVAKAVAEATAAANARFAAVLASDHFTANSDLGKALLANDKLSAEDITGYLALAAKPVAAAAPAADADDDKARADMRDKIAASQAPPLGADAEQPPANATEVAQAGWGKATAHANQVQGYN